MGPLYICLLLFWDICQVFSVNQTSEILQESGLKTAEVGETVTLSCFCPGDAVSFFAWYQQSLGGKPHLVSSRMKNSADADISPSYRERFEVITHSQEGTNNLIIRDLQLSDSGMYYCGVLEFNAIEFGQGVFLHVKMSSAIIRPVIYQPVMKRLRLGECVSLICTVYPEPCSGDLHLFWFRDASSQPAVVYPSEGHCSSLSDEKLHRKNCTLNLEIISVSSSDAGTYHCALDSCGQIVFGDGTKVEVVVPPVLVYCLAVALVVSSIVLLILSVLMYKLKLKLSFASKGTGSSLRCSAPSDAMQSPDAGSLHYAALSLKMKRERQQPGDSDENVCVYTRVKSRD